MKNRAKKAAAACRKQFGLCGIPCVGELERIIEGLNYELRTYEQSADLLAAIQQTERAKYVPSFCCSQRNHHYVFYSGKISKPDLVYILAHEIGHIYLNHMHRHEGFYDTSAYKEREAHEFAQVLVSLPGRKRSKICGIGCILFFVCLFAGTQAADMKPAEPVQAEPQAVLSIPLPVPVRASDTAGSKNTPAYTPVCTAAPAANNAAPDAAEILKKKEAPSSQTENGADSGYANQANQNSGTSLQAAQTTEPGQAGMYAQQKVRTADAEAAAHEYETVIITATGEKYHTADCGHVQNRTNIRSLSLEEAARQGYAACKDCYE